MLIIYLYCIKKKHISDVFFTFVEIYGLYVKKLIIISQLINTNMNNKITLLLISLLMSIVCFSSCSDDDDSDSISIVGTWRWVDDSGNTQETYTFTSKQTYREEWSDGDWSGSESGSYFFDQKTKILFCLLFLKVV